ncbi:MAG: FIG019045: long form Mg-chelase associated protein with vWA domain [uncultured Acidimicrobiales bacterium]|uniref:FIG019045: long form Mg-chelase associated protein with vWA domain n=1 Tax=uncultured Acidimicrobiales bacterium TaxID=310071 RepID=A0A6J4IRW4_9ACTN|nr:MAG: FIG019045: long form Mg-chelase associated protein with vWA domain [uncultured Acidimicrobiales bacterium]
MSRFRYSRWDGSQVGFELDADDIMAELTDDLLYHGDLNAALRRMLQQGFRDRNDERVSGIRELMEKLRRRKRDQLEKYDLGGAYDDIAQELREVVEQERQSLQELVDEARASGDQRRQEITDEVAQERQAKLDFLPPDLAGQVKELQEYEFTSSEARERFDELLDKLRQQLMQSQFNQMAGALQDMGPEQMQRMKDMMNGLNQLLEMREAGQNTDSAFQQFMERFGDFFPDNPETLDELLEQMAQQMAAAQAMLNSMTPEQRAQLQGLMNQLMEDMDLRWQMDRLGQNLRSAFPEAGWEKRYNFSGQDPLGMAEGAQLMNELGDIDQLENLLRSANNPGALADVDIDRARELLGDEGAQSLEKLAEMTKMLEQAGLIENKEGRLELTPRGLRKIGSNALNDLFAKLDKDRMGRHQIDPAGIGHERTYETKPYEFGDPFNLQIERTVRNAITRTGGGTPVSLSPEDFEIERTETLTRTSTVLMLDLSLSMPMRDNFLAAKKVAMALHSLISSQYPRDFLGIVGFSEVARELKAEQLPEVSWDFVYGTNMQHAFQISRRLLGRQTGTKQIIMITDGEPTAHIMSNGEPFFNYPPVQETVDATLAEVNRCTRDGIRINTFMLDATSYLRDFVEKLTQMNQGRAFFTTPETLGDYVLVDFIEQKRAMRGGRGGRRAG